MKPFGGMEHGSKNPLVSGEDLDHEADQAVFSSSSKLRTFFYFISNISEHSTCNLVKKSGIFTVIDSDKSQLKCGLLALTKVYSLQVHL